MEKEIMKLSLIQAEFNVNDIERNLDKAEKYLREAKEKG